MEDKILNQSSNVTIPKNEIWRGAIAWMVNNSVAANILMMAMLVGGFLVLRDMKQEVMPEFEIDTITISTSLSGASAEEIESAIVLVLESTVAGIDGIDEITSTVRKGSASVVATMVKGVDADKVLDEVQAAVNRISTFPDETKTPTVSLMKRTKQVMTLILSGSNDPFFLQEWATNVVNELLGQRDITQVSISDEPDREIIIEISQATLRKYGLTLSQVSNVIKSSSVEQGAGNLETDDGSISLTVSDRKQYVSEFARIPIVSLEDGSRVLLEDIADVYESLGDEGKNWSRFNGTAAVQIDVYRIGNQTPQKVAAATLEVIEILNETMPAGLRLAVQYNDAQTYYDRVKLLTSNATTGIILVFLCLALFLEPKLAFWVSLGIPIAIMGSFTMLGPLGSSINMMTMFAFILTLGIVVDDAIVVGENIHIWRRKGYTRAEAAVLGAREVSTSIIFSVLTNIVAFIPILLIPGTLGLMYAPIVPVICLVFFCSLIESLFVLPCHLAHDAKPKKKSFIAIITDKQEQFSVAFTKWVERVYGPFLKCALKFKYSVVAACIGLLIISAGFIMSGRMGMELMPVTESDYAFVQIEVPTGTSTEEITEMADQLYQSARKLIDENGGERLSPGVYVTVRPTSIQGYLYLTHSDIRPLTTSQVTELWQKSATGGGAGAGAGAGFRNVESINFQADRGGPGSGKALSQNISHRDTTTLEAAVEALSDELLIYPTVSDISSGMARQRPEYLLKLTPTGEMMGLTSDYVATQLRASFEGQSVLTQQRGAEEITVRVRLPEDDRTSHETFSRMIIRTAKGEEVMLRDVVDVIETTSPGMIRRTNGARTLNITGNVTPRTEAGLVLQDLQATIFPDIISKFPGLSIESGGMQKDIDDSMAAFYSGLVIVLLAIYVLLAIPFKSYFQPIIIMVAIPFGIVGALIGHIVMGYSLSVISMLGLLALSGLIVNDSLMLIVFANNGQAAGMKAYDAVVAAGIRRFRPILLTTITTFVGLMPMLLETSRQARQLIPVAISLGFGILFGTVITLVLVPSLYLILDDFKKRKHEDFSKHEEGENITS